MLNRLSGVGLFIAVLPTAGVLPPILGLDLECVFVAVAETDANYSWCDFREKCRSTSTRPVTKHKEAGKGDESVSLDRTLD